MNAAISAVFAVGMLALFGTAHWYVWRRLVKDITVPRGIPRRLGTVLTFLLPAGMVGAQLASVSGAPFPLQQLLSWTGHLWAVLLLYLLLALLVTEVVRPVLLRRAASRGAAGTAVTTPGAEVTAVPATRPHTAAKSDTGTPTPAAEPVPTVEPATAVTGSGALGAASTEPHGGSEPAVRSAHIADGSAVDREHTGTVTAPETSQAVTPEATVASAGANPGEPAVPNGGPPSGRPVAHPSRRLFIARSLAAVAAAAATATVGYGLYNARQLRTVDVTVPITGLPSSAEGYRITVMSDLHAGPAIGRSHTELVVAAMNRTEPDVMVVVGDLVDAGVDDLRSTVAPLAELSSPDGVYYVTGNHEYYVGAAPWVEHVQRLGMIPLENERVRLGAGFDLAGVHDLEGEQHGAGPDLNAALADRDVDVPVVLLSHQPQIIDEAVRHNVDLTISGHTHGGQVWPGPYLAAAANPTLFGLERYGNTQLYVTRGAGAWGPPVRVGADPDISVLTLTSA